MPDPFESLARPLREQGEDSFWTQELCRRFRPLSFWHIRWKRLKLAELSWREVGEEGWAERSYHAEIRFGKEARRDAYILKHLGLAAKSGKVQWPRLFGIRDVFYPLGPQAVLYGTQFLDEAPTPAFAAQAWSELSGRAAVGNDPDFAHFARVLASLPVLEPSAFRALEAHLDYFGAFLLGRKNLRTLREKALRLRRDALLPTLLPSAWVDLALGKGSWRPVPWHYEKEIAPWVTEEIGITRIPNVCMALAPALEDSEARMDSVTRFLELRRFQREMATWARARGEAVAAPWEEHGVTLLTHARGTEAQARSHLQDLGAAARRWARERFGWRVRVGLGPRLAGGQALGESWSAAVAALHRAVALDKDVQSADEKLTAPLASRPALMELKTALDGGEEALRSALDHFLQAALRESRSGLDFCRGILASAWQELLWSVAKNQRPSVADEAWQRAGDLPRLLTEFKAAVMELGKASRAGAKAPQERRLSACLAFLRERHAEAVRLPELAARFGFSVPVFCRRFKAATGETLNQHLRRLRIEHAAILLRSGELDLESIAKRCGFGQAHGLIRAFRQVHGQTPGQYRQKKAWK